MSRCWLLLRFQEVEITFGDTKLVTAGHLCCIAMHFLVIISICGVILWDCEHSAPKYISIQKFTQPPVDFSWIVNALEVESGHFLSFSTLLVLRSFKNIYFFPSLSWAPLWIQEKKKKKIQSRVVRCRGSPCIKGQAVPNSINEGASGWLLAPTPLLPARPPRLPVCSSWPRLELMLKGVGNDIERPRCEY